MEPRQEKQDPGYGVEDRELPGFKAYLKPRNLFSWTWNFTETWVLSRRYSLLLTGIPVLLFVVIGMAFVWWLKGVPDQQLGRKFETALKTSYEKGEAEKVRVYSEHILKLQPNNHPVRFRLVQFLAENDYANDVKKHAGYLVDPNVNYLPAQLWLLQQSLQQTPFIPLNEGQVEATCHNIFRLDSDNSFAKRILSEQLIKAGEYKAAEDHLSPIVADNPDLGLPLAEVQQRLNRDPEIIQSNLQKAQEFYRSQVLKNPTNDMARALFADSARKLGKYEEAERVLLEGRKRQDSQELQSALARHFAEVASIRLKASPLNFSTARSLTLNAVQLDPSNRKHLIQALSLSSNRSEYLPRELQPAIDELRAQTELSEDDRSLLIEILAASQQYEEALKIVDPLIETNPELRIAKARLLLKLDRKPEALTLIENLLMELAEDESEAAALTRADLLVLSHRYSEAREQLVAFQQTAIENGESIPRPQAALWSRLNGVSAFALFEQQITADKVADPSETMNLLQSALQSRSTASQALDRLAQVAMSDAEIAGTANQMLTRLLASGNANAEVYLLVGTRALQAGQLRDARRNLEIAYRMNKSNPMLLNNLAVSIVRDNSKDKSRALQLCNEALNLVPEHAHILSTRAEVFIAMERWEDARMDLEIALQTRKKSPEVRRLLVQVCRAMEQPDLADEHQRVLNELEST